MEDGHERRGARAERADGTDRAADPSTFDAELALIKRAKAELDAGRPSAALALLSEHGRRFPRGTFAGEREALLILALCTSGRLSQGRSLARRFAAAHPRSPLVDRVRRACDLEDTQPGKAKM
jgi:outer membrane protein assembly factor BamD (BamD/ComL family)